MPFQAGADDAEVIPGGIGLETASDDLAGWSSVVKMRVWSATAGHIGAGRNRAGRVHRWQRFPNAAGVWDLELSGRSARDSVAERLWAEVLDLFNRGQMDRATALERLQIGRTQLYRLRTAWLKDRKAFRQEPPAAITSNSGANRSSNSSKRSCQCRNL